VLSCESFILSKASKYIGEHFLRSI
jgi:hypothetical protein